MIRIYDKAMQQQRRYYQRTGYYNFGYWGRGAASQPEACDALVGELLSRIEVPGGRILDVACGVGATTKRISRSYLPENIVGTNISDAQIADARKRAPGVRFEVMDATKLAFSDGHFDAVISVEAAFHLDTRDAFLKEAFRVLKQAERCRAEPKTCHAWAEA